MSPFSGTWSGTGRRHTIATETGHDASIISWSGAVVLERSTGLASAFHAEAIGFDAGAEASTGRAVWTDTRGDRVFSTMTGEALAQGRRVAGTIMGGTGRYAGVTGDYELTWQYAVADESDAIHGRSTDFHGRIRRPRVSP
jgi:hypothetical protein